MQSAATTSTPSCWKFPSRMLTVDGKIHPATRQAGGHRNLRQHGAPSHHGAALAESGPKLRLDLQQVNREGNSLINEAIIGTGFKDRFSMDFPVNDSQFANFVLEPVAAGVFSSLGVPVPPNPRTDLLILAQYEPPICPGCGPRMRDRSPICCGSTPAFHRLRWAARSGSASSPATRLAIPTDADRSTMCLTSLSAPSKASWWIPRSIGLALGDGVNTKTEGFNNSFPYVMPANSGRNSAHTGPGQAGCTGQPGGICPVK